MHITLCEDDSIFFNGIPRNVILLVKFDDGKQIRVPYSAEKSISAMYEDLNAIAPQVAESPQMPLEPQTDKHSNNGRLEPVNPPKPPQNANKGHFTEVSDKANIIEKEDIVTLVKLEDRGEGASCDLVVGQEYRVIKVIAVGVTLPGRNDITQQVQGYDVVNDDSPRPERTRVFPHEVALARKRKPPIPKGESKIEEILPCPYCQAKNALALEGSAFVGDCTDCKSDIKIERILKKCTTEKCGNDVALFDQGPNGSMYRGVCNKCKGVMEVAYA